MKLFHTVKMMLHLYGYTVYAYKSRYWNTVFNFQESSCCMVHIVHTVHSNLFGIINAVKSAALMCDCV